MRELEPRLITAYSEVNIEFENPIKKEELSKMASKETGYLKNRAMEMIRKSEKGEQLIRSYPYPVQFWQMENQSVVADLFVMGYSNDVMSYIPTVEILREGGYEGYTSLMAFGLPATCR